jgi:hypothetical protein
MVILLIFLAILPVRLVALITMYSMALYVLFKVMLKVVFQLPPIGIPSNHC